MDFEEKRRRCMLRLQICERAEKMGIAKGDHVTEMMDMDSADLKFCLRLEDMLNADDENFAHDFCGIQANIDRSVYPSNDFGCFVPRFAEVQ